MKTLTALLLFITLALPASAQVFLPSPTAEQTGYYQVVQEKQIVDRTGVWVEVFAPNTVAQFGAPPQETGLLLGGWFLPPALPDFPVGRYFILQADNIVSQGQNIVDGLIVETSTDAQGVYVTGVFQMTVDPDNIGDLNTLAVNVRFREPIDLYGTVGEFHDFTLVRPNRATANRCRPTGGFSPPLPAVYPCLK